MLTLAAYLGCQAVNGRNDAFHQTINDNVTNVVHIRLPSWSSFADFQGAIAAGQQLCDLLASIRDQAVALG